MRRRPRADFIAKTVEVNERAAPQSHPIGGDAGMERGVDFGVIADNLINSGSRPGPAARHLSRHSLLRRKVAKEKQCPCSDEVTGDIVTVFGRQFRAQNGRKSA